MLVWMSPPPNRRVPHVSPLLRDVGFHTADTEGFAGNWKREARNLTLKSTVSAHGFSRADRSTLVILSAASRFASRIEMRSRRACPERSRTDSALPHLCTTAARHSRRARVGRTLLSAAADHLTSPPRPRYETIFAWRASQTPPILRKEQKP